MSESNVMMLFFWMGVLLWDHAANYDTATHPAPNASWFLARIVAIIYYAQACILALHMLAKWIHWMGWAR